MKIDEDIEFTETWMIESVMGCSNMDGYGCFPTMRAEGRGVGVSIFSKECGSGEQKDQFRFFNGTIETCVVQLRLKSE